MTAYNNVGLHTTLTSDGFIVDNDYPVTGVVFNTNRHTDKSYQHSNTTFSLSWHGFVDHHTGIKSYHVAIGEDGTNVLDLNFTDVGLFSQYTFTGLTLGHGKPYCGFVKAYDASGHMSNVSVSQGVIVDTTPPRGFACSVFQVVSNDTTILSGHRKFVSFLHAMKRNVYYRVSGRLYSSSIDTRAVLTIDRFRIPLPLTINHDKSRDFLYNFLSPISGEQNVTVTFMSEEDDLEIQTSFSTCLDIIQTDSLAVRVTQIGPSTVAVNIMIMDNESYASKV